MNCKKCGKELFDLTGKRRFCRVECRKSFHHEKAVESREILHRTCGTCGKEFDTVDQRKIFCSAKCSRDNFNAHRKVTKFEERTCPVCNKKFQPLQIRGVGKKCCSDECTDIWGKKRSLDNRRYNPEAHKNRSLQSAYGITLEQYRSMNDKQNGLCAICGKPERESKDGKVRGLNVDHCHKNGHVRELLCSNCNQALGFLQDDKTVLQSAINYLTKHEKETT